MKGRKDDILMEEKEAIRVSKISIIANLVLSGLKLLAGIIASSYAMISDAIHSASDVVSSVIVIVRSKNCSKRIRQNASIWA